VADFSHPTPAIGVNNEERDSLLGRIKVDLAMGLALIHHLAIGKNIPFDKIARMFAGMGRYLIIEFVPKEDEKIRQMLTQKKDIYDWYHEQGFLQAFQSHYTILERQPVENSGRTLFLMELKLS
jgi:hypothetical protein